MKMREREEMKHVSMARVNDLTKAKPMLKLISLFAAIAVVFACAGTVFAMRNDPVLQKERDRLIVQKDYSSTYAASLEGCAPYEKTYDLTELNATRRLNGIKEGGCSETILYTDKENKPDSMVFCEYPQDKLKEIAASYKRLISAEDNFVVKSLEQKTESGLYKITRTFDGVDYVQPTFYYCKVK